MSDENIENKYPHWRDALFGNHNAVANIRCAAHYVFWHSVYALMAIVGGILVAGLTAIETAAQYTGPIQRPIDAAVDRAIEGVMYTLDHEITEALTRMGILFLAGYVVVALAYVIMTNPVKFGITIGMVIAAIVVLFVLMYISEKLEDPAANAASATATKARAAGEKAAETPGIRRVYGRCPVSMEQSPKWFDNLFGEL